MPTFSYTQDMMKTVDRVPSENMSVGSTWAFPCRVFHGGSAVKIRVDSGLSNFLLPSLRHLYVLRGITQLETLTNRSSCRQWRNQLFAPGPPTSYLPPLGVPVHFFREAGLRLA